MGKRHEEMKLMYEYIKKNKGCTIKETAEATKLPKSRVRTFVFLLDYLGIIELSNKKRIANEQIRVIDPKVTREENERLFKSNIDLTNTISNIRQVEKVYEQKNGLN